MTDRRLAILAEGSLDFHHGKTAASILRYRPEDVIAVIDSENAGKTTGEVLGLAGDVPIVANVADTFRWNPSTLLIGIAPRGGGLPAAWRSQILHALDHGLNVESGLHVMLSEDEEFAAAAAKRGTQLIDVRRPPEHLRVAEMRPHRPGSRVITFVGSDCAVGKMTAALEVRRSAEQLGMSSAFVATGQTGIMLEGSGVAVDRVIGDFMAGAIEELVVQAAERADWVFVEGQGSLLHPGYSGVTLALLHGSAPDGMILVHPPTHTEIDEYPITLPPLQRLIAIHEEAASWTGSAPVVAVALNTRDMSEEAACAAVSRAKEETGLPSTDPVRFGGTVLAEACRRALGGS